MVRRKNKVSPQTLPLPFMREAKVDLPHGGDTARLEQPHPAPSEPLWQEYHRAYYEQRRSYLAALLDAYRSFDRTMTTLSAGALGLSVAFIKDISPEPKPHTVWSLYAAWGLFGAALVLILASFWTSQQSWQRAMQREDEAYANGGIPHEGGNAWSEATNILNTSCWITFAAGVAAFVWFSCTNFTGGN